MKASPVFGPRGRVCDLPKHDGPTFICRVRLGNARLLVCGSLPVVMIWVRLALAHEKAWRASLKPTAVASGSESLSDKPAPMRLCRSACDAGAEADKC